MFGNDQSVPIVHQDLATSSMPPFANPFVNPFGYGAYTPYYPNLNTNYLGGIRLAQQLDRDKLEIINKKEQQDKNVFMKALAGLAVIVALGSIAPIRKSIQKAGGIKEYSKKIWNNVVGLFKKSNSKNK